MALIDGMGLKSYSQAKMTIKSVFYTIYLHIYLTIF